jgi:hypothetical protein
MSNSEHTDRTEKIRERAYYISLLRPIRAPEADWYEAEREIDQEEQQGADAGGPNSQTVPNAISEPFNKLQKI